MKVDQARIFISYARKDLGKVKEIYDQLKESGFFPWQDIYDILPGELWHDALMRGIREAPFFLACLSNNSVNKRGMIQEELKEALQVWRRKLDDDIYFIPIRLEECAVPEALAKFQWVDIYADGGFEKLFKALRIGMEKMGIISPLQLRSQPAELSDDDVKMMLEKYDFFDVHKYWMGKGIHHLYEFKVINGDSVVTDHATRLMWEKSGSKSLVYSDAKDYILEMNKKEKYAGFQDWRLPTLEEAMSLMEPVKNDYGIYISSHFDSTQTTMWTADGDAGKSSQTTLFDMMSNGSRDAYLRDPDKPPSVWVPAFIVGDCTVSYLDYDHPVRAVRSLQSS